MTIDLVALDTFLTGTAFAFAYQIAGAVIAMGFALTVLFTFRDDIIGVLND